MISISLSSYISVKDFEEHNTSTVFISVKLIWSCKNHLCEIGSKAKKNLTLFQKLAEYQLHL